MKKNVVEALIGAAVLVVAVGFFITTYKTTEFGRVEGYHLSARFDRVDGLKTGGDVRIGGIKVGTILSQKVDLKTYQAVLELSIDPKVRLPVDTSAKIRSENLLGGSYLSLEPGGDDEYLADGDEIEFTQGSVDVIDLIGREIFSADNNDKDNGEKE